MEPSRKIRRCRGAIGFVGKLVIRHQTNETGFGWTHAVFLVLYDELSILPHECCVCRRAECYDTFPGLNRNRGAVPDVAWRLFEVASTAACW
ncbi:hypothetical protein SBBP2_3100002 [Burkholderiales bacterium]|nr:hypothetical protein SBBP2_3100002 [Burkholderiales bacterium]